MKRINNKKIDKKDPTPRYHQLRIILEDSIKKGKYEIGGLFPTEIQLAKEYGLSRMTVRQSLDELEKEKFIIREQGRGTFVIRTDSTKKNKTINIGVVIYKPALESQWFFPEVISGIHADFESKDVNLVLLPFDEKTPYVKEQKYISHLIIEKDLKGLIITAEELDKKEIEYLQKHKIPFILVNIFPAISNKLNYICPDFKSGIQKITKYLISLGHTQIGFIGTLFSMYHLESIMKESFLNTMSKYGLKANTEFVLETNYLHKNVPFLLKKILQKNNKPTAIVCTDDTLAVKVINTLGKLKIKVPEEISVTGLNDLDLAQLSRPALTTLQVPRYEMGKKSAEFIYKSIDNNISLFQKILPLKIIIRDSVKEVIKNKKRRIGLKK